MKTLRWLQPTFNTLLGVVLTLGMLFGYGIVSAQNLNLDRFELIKEESHDWTRWNTRIFVFHDKEAGEEIVCTQVTGDSVSCVTTGRKW